MSRLRRAWIDGAWVDGICSKTGLIDPALWERLDANDRARYYGLVQTMLSEQRDRNAQRDRDQQDGQQQRDGHHHEAQQHSGDQQYGQQQDGHHQDWQQHGGDQQDAHQQDWRQAALFQAQAAVSDMFLDLVTLQKVADAQAEQIKELQAQIEAINKTLQDQGKFEDQAINKKLQDQEKVQDQEKFED